MDLDTPPTDNTAAAAGSTIASSSPRLVHILGPFNSGSSFAESLLRANGVAITDLAFQQTLFKHYPPTLIARLITLLDIDCSGVLFVAVARDPSVWIEAIERNPYELLFDDASGPCRFDTTARNFYMSYSEHLSGLGLTDREIETHFSFTSVYDLWASSYQGYIDLGRWGAVTIVRYEDLLGDTVRSVLAIRDRLGLPQPDVVTIPLRPAKEHGNPRTYVEALDKLARLARGPSQRRRAAAVAAHLDPAIMAACGYHPMRGRRGAISKAKTTDGRSGEVEASPGIEPGCKDLQSSA